MGQLVRVSESHIKPQDGHGPVSIRPLPMILIQRILNRDASMGRYSRLEMVVVEYRTPDYGKIGIGTDEVMENWSKVKRPFKGLTVSFMGTCSD